MERTPEPTLEPTFERTIATRISAQGHDDTAGIARIHELSDEAKTSRARKAAGVCVGIGVASLFIPLVHFVLPWLMLIIATIVYGKVVKQGAILLAATGPCPGCGARLEVAEQTLEWPIEWNCGGCRKRTLTQPAIAIATGIGEVKQDTTEAS